MWTSVGCQSGAVVGGGREVDLDARLVEREPRERHVVLPADQAADQAERGGQSAQAVAVALAPDQALVVGRHELAVLQGERAVGGVVEQRVVDRRRPRRVDLVDARDDPDAVPLGRRGDPVGGGPGTSTDSRASRANASFASATAQPASARAQTDDG